MVLANKTTSSGIDGIACEEPWERLKPFLKQVPKSSDFHFVMHVVLQILTDMIHLGVKLRSSI